MLQRTIAEPSTLADALAPRSELLGRASRWLAAAVPGPEQPVCWPSPHRVVLETPALRLLRFDAERGGGASPPLLIVPPEVNGANLADYGPGQSLVDLALRSGFGAVAAVDWRTPSDATRDLDVDDSIAGIEACIEGLGGSAVLAGICQGGWESAIVAARQPHAVLGLVLAGAAIDFRAGDAPIRRLVDSSPPAAYDAFVAAGGGVMRGDLIRMGFDFLQAWDRFVIEPLRLWNELDDPAAGERRRRMERWYRVRKDLPGVQYRRVVEELFRQNLLIQGRFRVRGERVDLGRIRCPVALVAGLRDPISPPEQVWAAEAAVSPAARVRRFPVDAGHIGLVIGRDSMRRIWPEVFRFLQEAPSSAPGP
jgi:poly(3-hydroxyalkanoate) synthetase